jgi:hypothetical protein
MVYATFMQEWYIDSVNFHRKQSFEFDELPKQVKKLLTRVDADHYVEFLEEIVRDAGIDLKELQSVPDGRKVDL